ncbi:hypothetical protein MMC31_007052 [Peltigera leucophlebia]|nr:hypothetical protein [Peltigera leucophlebia]
MVLPGWNVTEPLHVAARFAVFVQKYRGAPQQIKSFALEVEVFRGALKVFERCFKNPDSIPEEDLDSLKAISVDFQRCANDCQAFIGRFFDQFGTSAKEDAGAGGRLNAQIDRATTQINRAAAQVNWLWKTDEANALKHDMSRVVAIANLHLGVATQWTLRKNSIDPIQTQQPLTPGDILFPPDKQPPLVTSSSPPVHEPSVLGKKCDDTAVPGSFSRRAPMVDFLPLELPLGDSDDYLCPPALESTMDKLDGVFISHNPQKKPLPVQKLEFVRATSGGLRYVIVTLSPSYLARFFHRFPPLPDVMPHTEPPHAYAYIDPLRIKFLECQELRSQRWVSSNASPSIRSISSQSAYGASPETLLPSDASVYSSQSTLGSPSLLPVVSYTMTKEKFPPTYTFRSPEGYKKFQQNVVGKELLCYPHTECVESQNLGSKSKLLESDLQYVRLWRSWDTHSITMTYYQNQLRPPRYVQYSIESFCVNEKLSTGTCLQLDVKRQEVPKIKRPRTITLSFKSTQQSPEIPVPPVEIVVPPALIKIASIFITFSEVQDKKDFKENAFPSSAVSPVSFRKPSWE